MPTRPDIPTVDHEEILKGVFDLANAMADTSTHLKVVKGEMDDSPRPRHDAATFLKHDGRRVGRDLELYGLMAKVQGWQSTLTFVLGELVQPVRRTEPDAYRAGVEGLASVGALVYADGMLADWIEILQIDEGSSAPPPP